MFDPSLGGNIFNDPYMLAWKSMTGIPIKDKKDPIRQVSKSAVLGLGFCMSPAGYARVLLTALADPKSKVTEDLLRELCISSGWQKPRDGSTEKIVQKLGCSVVVAITAYHIHRLFNEAHPEFSMTAKWLVQVVMNVAQCPADHIGRLAAAEVIERAYGLPAAPDRRLIGLSIDDDPAPRYASIRIACGPDWPATVCWREPRMRVNPFDTEAKGPRLTIRKSAGRQGTFKAFSPQIAIENVTQAAARNALCMGIERLEHMGYKDVIHVHDEIMIICKRDRDHVLAARNALLEVFGPGHSLPHSWSMLVKPSEVSVTESMYESEDDIDPKKFDRWGRIERNEPGCLEELP
jgi:hypothetical protein